MDPTFFLIYFDFFILKDLFFYEIWNQTHFIVPRLNLGLMIASPWHPDTPCRLLSLFIIRAVEIANLEIAKIKIRVIISLCILLKDYFPNLLEITLLCQIFAFWVRDIKFWLLDFFFDFLWLCKISETLDNIYVRHFTMVPPLMFFVFLIHQKFKGGTIVKCLI